MVQQVKRIALQILGWMFVLLGIAGLVLPVLQGILFLMIGLYLLSREYAWARRWGEKLRDRYPEIFRRARYWQVRLGLSRRTKPEDPQPLPRARRIAVLLSVLALLLILVLASSAGTAHLIRYWGNLRQRYTVVKVSSESNAQIVELRRTWALRNRHYRLRCHICEPVEVGASYHFEPVPGQNPPMMKRWSGPGEVPDFYTVLEGEIPQ
jgi:uncharacterized membrane protein YbaN (DUF454 family)